MFINPSCDEPNLSAPGLVMDIGDQYVRAGAEIFEANTCTANRLAAFALPEWLRDIMGAGSGEDWQATAGHGQLRPARGSLGAFEGVRVESTALSLRCRVDDEGAGDTPSRLSALLQSYRKAAEEDRVQLRIGSDGLYVALCHRHVVCHDQASRAHERQECL